jgi:hypothetical protein
MIDSGDVKECFQLALKYFQSREAISLLASGQIKTPRSSHT